MWRGISGSLPQSWVGWPGAPCSHSAIMLSNFNTRDLFNHFFCETAKGNPGLWWVEHCGMWGQRDFGRHNGSLLLLVSSIISSTPILVQLLSCVACLCFSVALSCTNMQVGGCVLLMHLGCHRDHRSGYCFLLHGWRLLLVNLINLAYERTSK